MSTALDVDTFEDLDLDLDPQLPCEFMNQIGGCSRVATLTGWYSCCHIDPHLFCGECAEEKRKQIEEFFQACTERGRAVCCPYCQTIWKTPELFEVRPITL